MKTVERKTICAFFSAACAFVFLVSGCGAEEAGRTAADSVYPEAFAEETVESKRTLTGGGAQEAESGPFITEAAGRTRKLIRSADLSIEADTSLIGKDGGVSGAVQKLEEFARRYSGYIEQSRADSSSVQCTVRIPSKSFDEFLAGMSLFGKIISRRENAEDVTLKYYDFDGRFAAKKNLLATFESYLGRAKNIEEIMQVETRIADLHNEIDWLGTRLTELSNLVDYSTVSLHLFNPKEVHSYTLGDRIFRLFGSFGEFASAAVIVIFGVLIFGIPVLILVILAYWLLLGRIGLLKKAFRLASGAKKNTAQGG
jgi:hypothetical protein